MEANYKIIIHNYFMSCPTNPLLAAVEKLRRAVSAVRDAVLAAPPIIFDRVLVISVSHELDLIAAYDQEITARLQDEDDAPVCVSP